MNRTGTDGALAGVREVAEPPRGGGAAGQVAVRVGYEDELEVGQQWRQWHPDRAVRWHPSAVVGRLRFPVTGTVLLRPVRSWSFWPREVDFDAAALQLLTDTPGLDHIDVTFGTDTADTGLTLRVVPGAPLGDVLMVFGGPGRVLTVHCGPVPLAVAAVLCAMGEVTGRRPRCRFPWPPRGLPQALAVLLLHRGDTAGQVRALLRRAEQDRWRRPVVHLSD